MTNLDYTKTLRRSCYLAPLYLASQYCYFTCNILFLDALSESNNNDKVVKIAGLMFFSPRDVSLAFYGVTEANPTMKFVKLKSTSFEGIQQLSPTRPIQGTCSVDRSVKKAITERSNGATR